MLNLLRNCQFSEWLCIAYPTSSVQEPLSVHIPPAPGVVCLFCCSHSRRHMKWHILFVSRSVQLRLRLNWPAGLRVQAEELWPSAFLCHLVFPGCEWGSGSSGRHPFPHQHPTHTHTAASSVMRVRWILLFSPLYQLNTKLMCDHWPLTCCVCIGFIICRMRVLRVVIINKNRRNTGAQTWSNWNNVRYLVSTQIALSGASYVRASYWRKRKACSISVKFPLHLSFTPTFSSLSTQIKDAEDNGKFLAYARRNVELIEKTRFTSTNQF